MIATHSRVNAMPVARFLLELSADLSPRTITEYGNTIRRWERSHLDPLLYLTGNHTAPTTRVTRGRILGHYFRWSVEHGFLAENPLAGVRFRTPAPAPIRPFTEPEIARLLSSCRAPVERAMILTLLQTGMRASELAAIKARDIDSEQGTVTIRAGKGGKSRILAASPELLEALGLLIGEKLGYQDVYRCVRQVGQRARVEDVHPHRFRHTFAHSFLAAGGDIGDLRVLLGHSSFAMTARYSSYFEGQRAVASHRRFLAG